MDLKKLEYILISHFRPTFLFVDKPNEHGDIYIVISSIRFNYLGVQERILDIFNLLNFKCPDILKEHLIVIEAYNSDQMNEILEETFSNE